MSNITDVIVDVRRGSGSSLEILYGSVIVKPTLAHSRATSIVLPAPSTFDIVDGTVTIPNMQPTPAPDADQMIAWGYTFVFKDRHSKTYEFLVGVPDSVTPVNFASLPRYAETKSPIWGEGPQGDPGESATVAVGTVTGGSTAQVNNSGTSTDAVLDFVLPQGPKGDKGDNFTYLGNNARTISDPPSTYPDGTSVFRGQSTGGWSGVSVVSTFKAGVPGGTWQVITSYHTPDTNTAAYKPLIRFATGAATDSWQPAIPFTYDLATTAANGLMSSADKSKLEGITPLANSKSFSDLASTYSTGVSIVQVRASDGWPLATTGTVVTHKTSTDSTAVGQWLYPVEGGEPLYRSSNASGLWTDFSAVATQSWVKDNAGQAGVINVKDYGAVGDGSTDDFEAVRSAFEAVKPGGTIFFPTGTYYTPYKTPNTTSNWIVLSKDNVTVKGEGEDTHLENFLLAVSGSYGTRKSLSLSVSEGDKGIATTSAHGFKKDSYIQLLSNVNAYSPDAGKWQLGSSSPTDGARPVVRFSETLQVAKVVDTTSVEVYSEVVYDTYKNSNSGLAHPITGLSTSQVRELHMVKGVTFQDLTFKNVAGSTSWRFFVARACADLTFKRVNTLSGDLPGSAIKISDSYNVLFKECDIRKALDTFSGSSWNTIFVGGGCQEVRFQNCRGFGEAQGIDLTPNRFTSTADYGGDTYPENSLSTIQFMYVDGCSFYGCSDGVTSHPGSYHFHVTNSLFEGGSTGVRARSNRSVIQNNIFNTAAAGVSLSAFVSDSLVSDNIISKKRSTKYGVYWTGISYSWASSEIMNENNVRNVVIRDNSLTGDLTNPTSTSIRLSGTLPTNMPEVTAELLARGSDISVINNTFIAGSMYVGEFVNRVFIEGNKFQGGSSKSHYILTYKDSAANYIGTNYFISGGGVGAIQTGIVTNTGHTYGTAHRVATQESFGGALTFDLVNTDFVFVANNTKQLVDGWAGVNAAAMSTTRASGAASLGIDAIPQDGTSSATINVLSNSPTSGIKQVVVGGRVLAENYRIGFGPGLFGGVGDPNGAVTAPIGSLYMRTDGGATTSLYVKTSGSSSTGWTAK